jgi:hypothetical protein
MQSFVLVPAVVRRASAEFARDGFAVLSGGVVPEFRRFAQARAEKMIRVGDDDASRRIVGKKRQYLFDFPDGPEAPPDLFDAVAGIAGVPSERLTLSERLIKVYDTDAPTAPTPHKDRRASELALGIPLVVPAGSALVLFPHADRSENPDDCVARYAEASEDAANVDGVRLEVEAGSAVLFRGSSIFHERIAAARTVILYLKFNTLGLDPLGHDARPPERRARASNPA